MKSYKNRVIVLFFLSITLFLTFIFFYLLTTIKLWTYEMIGILQVDGVNIMVFTSLDLDIFKDNNFFYYDGIKYNYKLISKEETDEGMLLLLETSFELSLKDNNTTIFLPNTKKTIFSLIIDSWRIK